MKKLIISIVVIAIGISAFFYFSTPKESEANGLVTIELIDENGLLVSTKKIDFYEGTTLFELLDENYDLMCANASYNPTDICSKISMNGRVVLGIDTVETNWTNSFLAIYINDDYAVYGIDSIPLNEGDVYRFEYTVVGGGSQ